MSRRLYVGNLSFEVSEEGLRALFGHAGGVEHAEIIKDRWTGVSRGFGFVDMITEEDAQCAIAELNGSDKTGRSLRVAFARPKGSDAVERA
jgi:RNA recognition motif-containing protein